MAPLNAFPLVLVALIGWRMIYRVRGQIGRQKLKTRRLVARIIIYSIFCLLIALGALLRPKAILGLGAGLVVGVPVALVGLRLTRFETLPEGSFYTPNPYIGIAIAALLIVRLAYRMAMYYQFSQQPQTSPNLVQSPLTLFLFGLLAGYYIAYYTGVLTLSRRTSVPA